MGKDMVNINLTEMNNCGSIFIIIMVNYWSCVMDKENCLKFFDILQFYFNENIKSSYSVEFDIMLEIKSNYLQILKRK